MEPFVAEPFSTIDKEIRVRGPGIDLRVDYDDVDHLDVRRQLRRMLEILNRHWED